MPSEPVLLRELLSHRLAHKGVVYKLPDEEKYEVSVYEWLEEKDEETGVADDPIWQRVSGPFIVDTFLQAEELAQETLQLVAAELPDVTVSAEDLQWLREYSGDQTAEYLDPQNFSGWLLISDTEKYEPLQIARIMTVSELYIIETPDRRWHLGVLKNPGEIECWVSLGSLQEAVDAMEEN